MVRKLILVASAKDYLSDFKKNFKSKARFLVDESVGTATAERFGIAAGMFVKIRITKDGIWKIRRFDTKEGIHREICVKFDKMK